MHTSGNQYIALVSIPRFAESGTWKPSSSYLTDKAGNYRNLSATDLAQPGIATSFIVGLVPSIDSKPSAELHKRISDAVVTEISPIARPAHVWIVPDMPKTRSGKIMRRVLAAISSGQDAGDVSTLANPEVVEELRRMVDV